jgi:hypothetical protein
MRQFRLHALRIACAESKSDVAGAQKIPSALAPRRADSPELTMGTLNVGNIDRGLRILLGLALLGLSLSGVIGYWGLIGLVPLLTGAIASCPLYSLFGVSTCKR